MTSLIFSPFTKMEFREEDKHVIKFFRQDNHYGAKRFLKEFPHKSWSRRPSGLNKIIRKINRTGTSKCLPGSGRLRTARTADKIEEVETLVLSQEDLQQMQRNQRQIAREVGISKRSINRIVKKDLRLICMKKRRAHELTVANKQARLDCSRLLLRRYPASLVHFIWFTDEKLFTVASPSNTQNDRLYVAIGTRKRDIAADRLLLTRPTFSKSLMVSVGVSSMVRTSIQFVELGVKINGQYYRDVLLVEDLLPEIREFSEF